MAPLTRAARSLRSANNADASQALAAEQAPQQRAQPRRQPVVSPPQASPEPEEIDDDEEDEDDEDDEDMEEDEDDEVEEPYDEEDSYIPEEHAIDSEQDINMSAHRLLTSADVQEALHPLRRAADRVGRQIEQFAEHLDKFKSKEASLNKAQKYKAACQLVKKYQTIAEDTVKTLSAKTTPIPFPRVAWNEVGDEELYAPGRHPDTKAADLARWKSEAQTWKLFHKLLLNQEPQHQALIEQASRQPFIGLSRYSPDNEIWDRFLETDGYAQECVIALQWFESTASSSPQLLDSMIKQLEDSADRGEGLWAHGWLYTKEAIKGQKRLRSWPNPLPADASGLDISMQNSDGRPLITQLDPDARSRQNRALQKQDECHERATWMTCWKMLREGASWDEVADWASASLEGWRAVSLCGSGGAVKAQAGGLFRFMSAQVLETWQSACKSAAEGATDPYEKAVYGLLCGSNDEIDVARTWEDFLYLYYNETIIRRYHNFVHQFNSHVGLPSKALLPENGSPHDKFLSFVEKIKATFFTNDKPISPFRSIQTTLLCRDYSDALITQGLAVRQAANAFEDSRLLPVTDAVAGDAASIAAGEDNDGLRVITHIQIILQSLGLLDSNPNFQEQISATPIGYLTLLLKAGKMDLLPLYASQLPGDLTAEVLGRALIDITDHEERQTQVTLMKEFGINVGAVLEAQWFWALSAVYDAEPGPPQFKKPNILQSATSEGKASSLIVRFIGEDITTHDDLLIRSLEWHRFVKDEWDRTCVYASQLYKHLLENGHLAAAREVTTRFSLRIVSQQVTGFDLSASGLNPAAGVDGEEEDEALQQAHALHKQLWAQTQTFRELEQLVLAIDALDAWSGVAAPDRKPDPHDKQSTRKYKETLGQALNLVQGLIDPLLYVDWLREPIDDKEAPILASLRTIYLPEIILAYNDVLHYAGHALTRECLLDSMDLATRVASDPNLTDVFMEAGRMSELVDGFARVSLSLLWANESHKGRKRTSHGRGSAARGRTANGRREPVAAGRGLDIWQVRPAEESGDGDKAGVW